MLQIPVEHITLANGLRVVISPDRSAPVATVGVYTRLVSGWNRRAAAVSRTCLST